MVRLKRLLALLLPFALAAAGVGVPFDAGASDRTEALTSTPVSCCGDCPLEPDVDESCPAGCQLCPRCAGVTAVLRPSTPVIIAPWRPHAFASTPPSGPRDGVSPRIYHPPRSLLS